MFLDRMSMFYKIYIHEGKTALSEKEPQSFTS